MADPNGKHSKPMLAAMNNVSKFWPLISQRLIWSGGLALMCCSIQRSWVQHLRMFLVFFLNRLFLFLIDQLKLKVIQRM